MRLPVRRIQIEPGTHVEALLDQEWLVTNGMGGYASGTIGNIPTRRYHGLLVAALPGPAGRTMMLDQLHDELQLPNGRSLVMGSVERAEGQFNGEPAWSLREFRLEGGVPVWTYASEALVFEKRLHLLHGQNTLHVQYQILQGDARVPIELRPAFHVRGHDQTLSEEPPVPWALETLEDRHEMVPPRGLTYPRLGLFLHGQARGFTVQAKPIHPIYYRTEHRRGYPAVGHWWSPGCFRATLSRDTPVTLVASTETWERMLELSPADAWKLNRERLERLVADASVGGLDPIASELVLAADPFVIAPAGRDEEHARVQCVGDEVRTVIAGYHWFTDWGRDTMISLEGLTLVTGRWTEAGCILRTFGHHVRDGLIPNLFPEGQGEGLYHTADATLWFFHALDRYLAYTGDRGTLQLLLPNLIRIYEAHLHGTRFGIGVDPEDGLLCQGAEGYQLTWMDAKVEDWVVTPRGGKAVEINALWYNALRLLERWVLEDEKGSISDSIHRLADRVQRSFNEKFWISASEGLYDVIEGHGGNDPACRPNQLFALSLPHPVLDPKHWAPVLKVVQERLLTPVGLRSLAPGHPDYKAQYFGDLRARDAAYHQGTVWGWLIGPFVDAWMRVHPEDPGSARKFLVGFEEHLSQACIGSISEVFDAEPPFHARGCIAQAWSVAEVLRAWCKATA
jgi:predicted glycogen debranching enzyme